MTRDMKLIMTLMNVRNTQNLADRLNIYQQALSIDNDMLLCNPKIFESEWVVQFIKDVFETLHYSGEIHQWCFNQLNRLFIELDVEINQKIKSEKLTPWLMKEGLQIVKKCIGAADTETSVKAIAAWGVALKVMNQQILPSDKINHCISIFSGVIRSTNIPMVKEAFRSWKMLVKVMASDSNWHSTEISQDKTTKMNSRIDLVLRAIKYKNMPEIAPEIFDCWWFCCISLGPRLALYFEEVAHGLLRFCVGGITEYKSVNEQFESIYRSVDGPLRPHLVSLMNAKLDVIRYSRIPLAEVPELLPRLLDVLESLISESPTLISNTKASTFDKAHILKDHSLYALQCVRYCDQKWEGNRDTLKDRIPNLFFDLLAKILGSQLSPAERSWQLTLFLAQLTAWLTETLLPPEIVNACLIRLEHENLLDQIAAGDLQQAYGNYVRELSERLENLKTIMKSIKTIINSIEKTETLQSVTAQAHLTTITEITEPTEPTTGSFGQQTISSCFTNETPALERFVEFQPITEQKIHIETPNLEPMQVVITPEHIMSPGISPAEHQNSKFTTANNQIFKPIVFIDQSTDFEEKILGKFEQSDGDQSRDDDDEANDHSLTIVEEEMDEDGDGKNAGNKDVVKTPEKRDESEVVSTLISESDTSTAKHASPIMNRTPKPATPLMSMSKESNKANESKDNGLDMENKMDSPLLNNLAITQMDGSKTSQNLIEDVETKKACKDMENGVFEKKERKEEESHLNGGMDLTSTSAVTITTPQCQRESEKSETTPSSILRKADSPATRKSLRVQFHVEEREENSSSQRTPSKMTPIRFNKVRNSPYPKRKKGLDLLSTSDAGSSSTLVSQASMDECSPPKQKTMTAFGREFHINNSGQKTPVSTPLYRVNSSGKVRKVHSSPVPVVFPNSPKDAEQSRKNLVRDQHNFMQNVLEQTLESAMNRLRSNLVEHVGKCQQDVDNAVEAAVRDIRELKGRLMQKVDQNLTDQLDQIVSDTKRQIMETFCQETIAFDDNRPETGGI